MQASWGMVLCMLLTLKESCSWYHPCGLVTLKSHFQNNSNCQALSTAVGVAKTSFAVRSARRWRGRSTIRCSAVEL